NIRQGDNLSSSSTATSSFSLYQQGSAANGSYSFSSLVYSQSASNCFSSQETTTAVQSGTQAGSWSYTPSAGNTSTFSGGGSGSYGSMPSTQTIASSSSGSAASCFSSGSFSSEIGRAHV